MSDDPNEFKTYRAFAAKHNMRTSQIPLGAETVKRWIDEYKNSLGDTRNKDMFSLGYQWADKPHRHVYDLCNIIEGLQAEIDRQRRLLSEWSEEGRKHVARLQEIDKLTEMLAAEGRGEWEHDMKVLRDWLEKAAVALKPFADILCLIDDKQPEKGRAFDSYPDDQHVFAVGQSRIITAGDLRRAFQVRAEIKAMK